MLLLTHTSSPSPRLSIHLSTPTITAHQGEDPITQTRLLEGESAWDTPKKVLEWIKTCPNLYCSAYPLLLHTHQSSLTWVGQMPKCPLRIFPYIAGTIQRTNFAIPGGGGGDACSIHSTVSSVVLLLSLHYGPLQIFIITLASPHPSICKAPSSVHLLILTHPILSNTRLLPFALWWGHFTWHEHLPHNVLQLVYLATEKYTTIITLII